MKALCKVRLINDEYYVTTKDWVYSESDIILGKCNNIQSLDFEVLTVTDIMPHSKSICCNSIWTDGSEEKILFTTDKELILKGISEIPYDLLHEIGIANEAKDALAKTEFEVFYQLRENKKYLHYDNFVYVNGADLIHCRIVSEYYTFTKEEILAFAHDIINLGMDLRQAQLSGHNDKSGNEVLKEFLDVELVKYNK